MMCLHLQKIITSFYFLKTLVVKLKFCMIVTQQMSAAFIELDLKVRLLIFLKGVLVPMGPDIAASFNSC